MNVNSQSCVQHWCLLERAQFWWPRNLELLINHNPKPKYLLFITAKPVNEMIEEVRLRILTKGGQPK